MHNQNSGIELKAADNHAEEIILNDLTEWWCLTLLWRGSLSQWEWIQCCQVLASLHSHIHLNSQLFWDLSLPPIKKFANLLDSRAQQKQNKMLWESLWNFYDFCPHIFMISWTNLLNMTKFASLQLMAAHSHFHSQHFLTAKNKFSSRFSKNGPLPRPPNLATLHGYPWDSSISLLVWLLCCKHAVSQGMGRVSTKFRRHGIPYIFFTSAYSLFRADCLKFCGISRNSVLCH